jgi:thiol-disulfide isomerase/thioredoxin
MLDLSLCGARRCAILASVFSFLLSGVSAQDAAGALRKARDLPGDDLVVQLEPRSGRGGPRWSPKGAKVLLRKSEAGLVGSFLLGPGDETLNRPVQVLLSKSKEDALSFDTLSIDADRDGRFGEAERLGCEPRERRKKLWSSWSAELQVLVLPPSKGGEPSVSAAPGASVQPYPINLWYVFDPAEADAEPALRWSRRGWMQGQAELASKGAAQGEAPKRTLHVAISELAMDGVYDRKDRWLIASDPKELQSTGYRGVSDHAWVGDEAWRIVSLHPSGLRVTLRRFDPGISRAEEERARDRFFADRRAARAKTPLAFGHDFAAAEALAKREGRPLFVDFETTWCGPCKQMDAMVYTAQAVVDAAKAAAVVAVKVDGDEHRELVKRFKVAGYPTMILLDAAGKELRRASGYQSVEAMRRFLSKGKPER